MFENEIDRRKLMALFATAGANSLSIERAVKRLGRLSPKKNELVDTNSHIPDGERRVGILLHTGLPRDPVKHILYDSKFIRTPMCFSDQDLEAGIEKYQRDVPWRLVELQDKELYSQIGTISPGGSELVRENYKSIANWIARALRNSWPAAEDIPEGGRFHEVSHRYLITEHVEGEVVFMRATVFGPGGFEGYLKEIGITEPSEVKSLLISQKQLAKCALVPDDESTDV